MSEIRANKIDAARRQIDVAIRMLFSNGDPVAIHTIAAAGFKILRDIADKNKKGKIQQYVRDIVKPGTWKIINKPANFFKHADHDTDEILENIQEEVNDFMILLACFYYQDLGYRLTPEMGVLMTWMGALHPNRLFQNTSLEEDFMILLACFYYQDLGYQLTPEMGVLMTWMGALHPNRLFQNTSLEEDFQKLDWLRSMSREDQLKTGKDLLSQVKQ